jgi:UDP-galactopyranose mutase
LTNPATLFNTAVSDHLSHDLICFSHLRWNFVFQRPQHLMTRFARERRVFFFEEPLFDGEHSTLVVEPVGSVYVVVPHLPKGLSNDAIDRELSRLLTDLLKTWDIANPISWYYTPMALRFSREMRTSLVVFDCMDELSGFHGAPRELLALEEELLRRADLVFTGGHSLYEAKKERHPRVFAFPSSVDVAHFAKARSPQPDPEDQRPIGRPRLGFFGVIDERLDLSLLDAIATARPEWQLVILGPTVKIDPAKLPRRPNIHYLGMKTYESLPGYLAGWNAALLPFAINEATRFISPTKTPEYLAAGCGVVSAPIRDVVKPYGEQGLVEIAGQPGEFIAAVDRVLNTRDAAWRQRVDSFLAGLSWDRTWAEMCRLMNDAVASRRVPIAALSLSALARPADVSRAGLQP